MSSQLFVCRGIHKKFIWCNKQLRQHLQNPFPEFPVEQEGADMLLYKEFTFLFIEKNVNRESFKTHLYKTYLTVVMTESMEPKMRLRGSDVCLIIVP